MSENNQKLDGFEGPGFLATSLADIDEFAGSEAGVLSLAFADTTGSDKSAIAVAALSDVAKGSFFIAFPNDLPDVANYF